MPFIPVPEAIEVRLRWSLGTGEEAINVLHFHNVDGAPITAASAQEIANKVGDAIDAGGMLAFIHTDNVFQEVAVKDISAADKPSFIQSWGSAGEEASSAAMPFSVALAATLRTAVGSRGGRGRVFMPGWSTFGADETDNGVAKEGVASAVKETLVAMQDFNLSIDFGEANFVLGVVSRHAHAGGDPLGAPIAPIVRKVEQITVNRRWDTQRRRSNKIRL